MLRPAHSGLEPVQVSFLYLQLQETEKKKEPYKSGKMARSVEFNGKNIFTNYQTAQPCRLCWPEREGSFMYWYPHEWDLMCVGHGSCSCSGKNKLQKVFCLKNIYPKKRLKSSWNKRSQSGKLAA